MEPTPSAHASWNDELQAIFRLARRTLRKWRPGLAAVVVGMLATGAVIQWWPKRWRSEAVVYYREGLQWTTTDAPNARRMGQRFKDMLLARTLLTKLIQESGLYPRLVKAGRMGEAVEEMRLAIGFRIDQSDVYAISYTGDSAGEAQKVVARLTDLLIAENARLRSEQTQGAGTFLDAEKKRTEGDLATREAALLRFMARHPEFSAEQGQAAGAMRGRARAAPEGDRESDAVVALRREEERLRRQITTPGQRTGPDPALVAAKDDAEAKLRAAQRDLNEKRAAYTEQHPDVRAAEANVRGALDAYRRAADALQATEPQVLSGRLQQVQEELATARRLQAAQRPQQAVPRTPEAAQRVVSDEAEWARLNREVAEARERLQQLDNRQFVASMTASMAASGQSSQIVVIDPAFLPAQPLGPSRGVKALIGLLAALVAGVAVALLFALYDDVVYEAPDLERLPSLPVLLEIGRAAMPAGGPVLAAGNGGGARAPVAGLLPGEKGRGGKEGGGGSTALARIAAPGAAIAPEAMPGGAAFVRVHRVPTLRTSDPRLVMLNSPESPAAAAFRVLRHRLRERGDPRTILVTSARGSEGKSFCAVNLAMALGEADRARVLLLETNFRAPVLASVFGFQPLVCAGEQLESHRFKPREPWEAVETGVPSLHTVAISPGSTAKPTLDRALNLAVAAFRMSGYDYIIVDSPEVLQSADVNLMQESVDLVLLSVRTRVSRTRAIRAALGQIGTAKVAGFALLGG
ncbi:MAG: hypothetical protein HZB56_20470 [Deltaproteobacteria bacterium]|nr:hypothetical protein [Deltaproteobacteria bacterium]